MLVPLRDADRARCGNKAASLATLLRAGLPVPDGVVVPFDAYRKADRAALDEAGPHSRDAAHLPPGPVVEPARPPSVPDALRAALARALADLDLGTVAVRSSADGEDGAVRSSAGLYTSVLGVRGADAVVAAVETCWASLRSERALDHAGADLARADHAGPDAGAPSTSAPPPGSNPADHGVSPDAAAMAVLVQQLVDADASGVMFTPARAGEPTRIEAAWGLGPGVVGGTVSPDRYRVGGDGTVRVDVADKRTRLDRAVGGLRTTDVPDADRTRPVLAEGTARTLTRLGDEVATLTGGPQDVEWAVVGETVWLLQARPVTVEPPPLPERAAPVPRARSRSESLEGIPGSAGTAGGPARVVLGPSDFGRVLPGDVLVCRFTDPAWTPLLRVAAAVVTETGGALSHAAIVARELGIPAVLGVPGATTLLRDDEHLAIDGRAGRVTRARADSNPNRSRIPDRATDRDED